VVYSADGTPTAGNGYLDGALPKMPSGVFSEAYVNHENRITWQPRSDIRSAVVIVGIGGGRKGYVMVGRSLKETERRISNLTLQVGVGCVGTLVASLILVVLLEILPITRGS
jgi:hypothetical protein